MIMEQAIRLILSHKAFNLLRELEKDPELKKRVYEENVYTTGLHFLMALRKKYKKGKSIDKESNDFMEFCCHVYSQIKSNNDVRLYRRELKRTRKMLTDSTGEIAALSVEAHDNRASFNTHPDKYIKDVILETFGLK